MKTKTVKSNKIFGSSMMLFQTMKKSGLREELKLKDQNCQMTMLTGYVIEIEIVHLLKVLNRIVFLFWWLITFFSIQDWFKNVSYSAGLVSFTTELRFEPKYLGPLLNDWVLSCLNLIGSRKSLINYSAEYKTFLNRSWIMK